WPSVYGRLDIIVNQMTLSHCNGGGTFSFYDHFLSLRWDHDVKFRLDDLKAKFEYLPGTKIWLTGKGLSHLIPPWTKGKRVVIA
ncbi:hypothetical protein HD554DRAFT_1990238, partial [Boletus coccyginus]